VDVPSITYNPGFHTDEDLIRSFVVRKTELDLILEVLSENTQELPNQHVLVIGPRGTGKTTLVCRVAAEVRTNHTLESRWFPIVFPEEAYEVSNAGEFWLEALFHLAEQTKDERRLQAYKDLKTELDDVRLRERALAQLMDFADQEEKRLLLIVENLNMLLGEQLDEHADWDLRHTLLNEPRLMLLGTATTRFDEIENIQKAWFEGFSTYELQPLNLKEHQDLWKALSGDSLSEKRLRPIQILTGGNPRLLRIFASFAANRSFRELMGELIQLIDTYTEYFKSQLDHLPSTERKVFAALLDFWDPITARDVSRQSRIDVNKASALLSRLVNRGIVTVVETTGRRKWYQATERLYNIYYLMRRRGTHASRVHAVVRFMVQFYEGEELVGAAVKIAEGALRNPDSEQRKDACDAYLKILDTVEPGLRSEILRATPKDFLEMLGGPDSIPDLADSLTTEQPDRPRRPSGVKSAKSAEELRKDEQALREAIASDPENAKLWTEFGQFLDEELKLYDEAEQAFRKAIDIAPQLAYPWNNLGVVLRAQRRYDEAEQAYRKAIEIDPEYAYPWNNLGNVLGAQSRYDEAEQAYRKAIEIDPEYALSWNNLTKLLSDHMDKWEEVLEGMPGILEAAVAVSEQAIQQATDFLISAAAAGYAEKVLKLITESAVTEHWEPLKVGLQIFLNKKHRTAQEILEIGKDVAQRIQRRAESRQ
jgi:tetratricopeptide (TPR) repeat protein